MVGRELVVRKEAAKVDLREMAAKATLRRVRQKGHPYIEIRRAGKGVIFFCTLCLTPCYSDTVLFDHLRGRLHAGRRAAADLTLLNGPTPWPFNDGVLFFDCSRENDNMSSFSLSGGHDSLALVVSNRSSGNEDEVTSSFIVGGVDSVHDGGPEFGGFSGKGTRLDESSDANIHLAITRCDNSSRSNGLGVDVVSCLVGPDDCLMIPKVLLKDEILSLRVQHLGIGQISYRQQQLKDAHGKITKIWCAWLGQGDYDQSDGSNALKNCEVAVVNLSYTSGLGRRGIADDEDAPASPCSFFQVNDSGARGKKKKKSFSDQEDYPTSLTDHSSSPSSDSSSLDSAAPNCTDLGKSLIPSKVSRQQLRKQKRLAAERTCDICRQPLLPGKDVATLLNCKTGNLACSSRNTNGAFHPFHMSCLIHWILLCEFEILANHAKIAKPSRGRKRKPVARNQITSVFCPECQGTGAHIQGEDLEKPTIPLSEMFLYKLKAISANKSWMKTPEIIENCSTGLHFPPDCDQDSQEKVMPLKLLHFFRAVE